MFKKAGRQEYENKVTKMSICKRQDRTVWLQIYKKWHQTTILEKIKY